MLKTIRLNGSIVILVLLGFSTNSKCHAEEFYKSTDIDHTTLYFDAQNSLNSDEINQHCKGSIVTTEGPVIGQVEKASCSFKGVPYAKAPTGLFRWEAPYPPEHRDFIFEAKDYSDKCMQRRLIDRRSGISEDCLKLNIWRPNGTTDALPVMVWFHGGANISGSSSKHEFSGERLSTSQNVIVVSINYRLGVFGFYGPKNKTARPENPSAYFPDTNLQHLNGNFGTLDQIAALKWIKNNIGAFGGDTNNVTIFGESAGAKGVCNMLVSPLSQGLFHRAIMQSSACNKVFSKNAMESRLTDIEKDADCDNHPEGTARCMENKDGYELLLDAGIKPKDAFNVVMIGSGTRRYNSYIDGIVITEQPLKSIEKGNFQKMPIIAGHNLNEEKLYFNFSDSVDSDSPQDYLSQLLPNLTMSLEEVFQLYTGEEYNASQDEQAAYETARKVWADYVINCPVVNSISAFSKHQSFQTYQYRFDYDDHMNANAFGATHGLELPFIFDSLDKSYFRVFLYNYWYRQKARQLVSAIQSYWGNFARSGSPNTANTPHWPSTMLMNYDTLILDLPITVGDDNARRNRCRILAENTARLLQVSRNVGF